MLNWAGLPCEVEGRKWGHGGEAAAQGDERKKSDDRQYAGPVMGG